MALATAAAIRDRIHTVIEGLTPTAHSTVKFLRHRNERDGKFDDWAEKNPAACTRRFQARQVQTDEPPDTSSSIEEGVVLNVEARVAYSQTGRFGNDNALDRDDVINADWLKINAAIGAYGRSNFTTATDGSYDCTPMPASMDIEHGNGVDYMVVRLQYRYKRSIT